jgi:hypothetical protein
MALSLGTRRYIVADVLVYSLFLASALFHQQNPFSLSHSRNRTQSHHGSSTPNPTFRSHSDRRPSPCLLHRSPSSLQAHRLSRAAASLTPRKFLTTAYKRVLTQSRHSPTLPRPHPALKCCATTSSVDSHSFPGSFLQQRAATSPDTSYSPANSSLAPKRRLHRAHDHASVVRNLQACDLVGHHVMRCGRCHRRLYARAMGRIHPRTASDVGRLADWRGPWAIATSLPYNHF